jgi:hypothetical protein
MSIGIMRWVSFISAFFFTEKSLVTVFFWERILWIWYQVSHIINEYRCGRTPNPDVLCNTRIKFGTGSVFWWLYTPVLQKFEFNLSCTFLILMFGTFLLWRGFLRSHWKFGIWLHSFRTLCACNPSILWKHWRSVSFTIIKRQGTLQNHT